MGLLRELIAQHHDTQKQQKQAELESALAYIQQPGTPDENRRHMVDTMFDHPALKGLKALAPLIHGLTGGLVGGGQPKATPFGTTGAAGAQAPAGPISDPSAALGATEAMDTGPSAASLAGMSPAAAPAPTGGPPPAPSPTPAPAPAATAPASAGPTTGTPFDLASAVNANAAAPNLSAGGMAGGPTSPFASTPLGTGSPAAQVSPQPSAPQQKGMLANLVSGKGLTGGQGLLGRKGQGRQPQPQTQYYGLQAGAEQPQISLPDQLA